MSGMSADQAIDRYGPGSDFKPPKRIKDPDVFAAFHAAEPHCLVCDRVRPNAAHLLGKGQLGDDVLANLIPLCGSGSSGCHGAYDNGHAHTLEGVRITPALVRDVIGTWLMSDQGLEARFYLIGKLGLEGSQAWAERMFGVNV